MANNGTMLKVLHIEDNPADAVFVRELLADTGSRWTLAHVRRLSEGLKILGEQSFDGVLLDLDLIDSRGLETLETVHRVYPSVPIVVLSGFKDETFGYKSLEKGTQDYLVKGQVNGSMLVRAMRYAIERKRTDLALQESEARLRSLFQEAAIGMTMLSPEGQFISVNPAFCEFLGYTEKELMGKSLREITFLEDWQKTSVLMHQLLTGEGSVHRFEKRYRYKTGGLVWGETRAVLVRDGLGKPAYFVVQVVDITARKLAENALRESEARFRTLTERATDLVLILDGRGEMLYKSLNVEHILGFPEKVALGEKIADLVHPDDRAELNRLMMEGVEQPGAIRKGELRLRHRTGAWRVMEAVARNLLDDPVIQGVVLNMRDITERKEAETALKESEERFRILVQRAPEAIAVFDVDLGRFVDVNFNAERLFGCTAEELLRAGPGNFYQDRKPDGKPVAESVPMHIEQALAGNEVVFERLLHNAEGRDVHCEVRLVRLPSSTRRLLRASYVDITERKRAEENVVESRQMLKAVMDTIPVRVFWKDRESKFLGCNKHFALDAGFKDPEELVGKDDYQMGWRDQADSYRADDKKIMESGVPVLNYEEPQTAKTGKKSWLKTSKVPLKNSKGQIIGVLGTYEDITEQKQAEEALRMAYQKLTLHVERTPVAVIEWDRDFRVTRWNPAAQAMFGFSSAEAVGQHASFILPESVRPHADKVWQALLKKVGGERSANWNVRKDGALIFCEWHNTSLVDAQGNATGVASLAQDITERKRAEETLKEAKEAAERTAGELARSNRDLEEFARVVSHDLKEPLRMVTGFLELLQSKSRSAMDVKSNEYIDYAVNGAQRMKKRIERLLEYSRAGGRARELAPTSLEKALNVALLNLKDRIDKTGAIVSHEPLPEVMADAEQLTQVLQNLVGNAIKFTKGRPEIHVGASVQDGNWLVSVRDNGIGIDPKCKDRIFQVFQRLNEPEQYEGDGMGLSICKKIVERHNGRIWVESETGRGSSFYFTLPQPPRPSPPKAAGETTSPSSRMRETVAV
ncbi:MAG: PAS domain S-box protein [Kiritimatiellia bacterium]